MEPFYFERLPQARIHQPCRTRMSKSPSLPGTPGKPLGHAPLAVCNIDEFQLMLGMRLYYSQVYHILHRSTAPNHSFRQNRQLEAQQTLRYIDYYLDEVCTRCVLLMRSKHAG